MIDWARLRAIEPSLSSSVLWDEPLSRQTYYRIGGPARALVFPKSLQDLQLLAEFIHSTRAPFVILGAGSNILAPDGALDCLVVKTSKLLHGITLDPSGESISVGAGVSVSTLLRRAAEHGWGGLEFLAGIPGLVGGAIGMNAGTHLGESAGALLGVSALSLLSAPASALEFSGQDLKFEYRRNLFLPKGSVIISSRWKITRGDPASVKKILDETLARRKLTQPLEYPSCGSVFKNPPTPAGSPRMLAWEVVERLGLKGHRIGNAQVSEKHSNWIVNLGGAASEDVRALIALIQERASSELGTRLEREVKYLEELIIR